MDLPHSFRGHKPWRVVALLTFAICMALALAPDLQAAVVRPPEVVMKTVPVDAVAGRSRGGALHLPIRTELLGATWSGPASGLQLRTRGDDGRWSTWVDLDDDGDGPDRGSVEARMLHGRHAISMPIWVGNADQAQLRQRGSSAARAIELTAINVTGTSTAQGRITARVRGIAAQVFGGASPSDAGASPGTPAIHLRAAWGAAPPRVAPVIADAARGVVIHHTDSPNAYSCSQVPALLRGFQRYHQRTMGWNDIGYNFLVDRCGGVWEGRSGGILEPVIGAHTAGFNTGTVGISLIGDYTNQGPSSAALVAVERLVAWRLDVAHVDPAGTMQLTARSDDKFPVGTVLTRPAVVGHRDLYPTTCPGNMAYRERTAIAAAAARIGGLKLTGVKTLPKFDAATGEVSQLDVAAQVTQASALTSVTVERVSDGTKVVSKTVTGSAPRIRFVDADLFAADGTSPPVWDLRVRIAATASAEHARPAVIDLGAPYGKDPGFDVTTPPESQVTPGAPPPANRVHLEYSLKKGAVVGAWLRRTTSNTRIATLLAPRALPATATATSRALDLLIPVGVPAGDYLLEVGIESDPAPGRSLVRLPITVVR